MKPCPVDMDPVPPLGYTYPVQVYVFDAHNDGLCLGQSDIKKLRRENEQLRREIWCLREECDRLTALLQAQEEEGEEEDEESESAEESTKKEWRKSCEDGEEDGLSVLTEEPEEHPPPSPESIKVFENGEKRCEEYRGALPPCLRVNCVHPFTAASTIDHKITPPVTVPEIVEAGWSVVGEKLVGARLVSGGGLYLSVADRAALTTLLEAGLKLRAGSLNIELHDVSQGTVVIALSGVPHTIADTQLAHTIAQFGPIIGYIETRYYRNVDTGERLARLKPQSSLPKRLYIEGHEICARILPHDELARLATLPSHIARRTNLHVRVNTPIIKIEGSNGCSSAPNGSTSNGSVPTTGPACGATPSPAPATAATATATATATANQHQPFTFPLPTPSTSAHLHQTVNKEEVDRSQSLPPGSLPTTPSPSTVRRGVSETDVGWVGGGSRRIRHRTIRRGRSPDNSVTGLRGSSSRRKASGSTRRNTNSVSSETNEAGGGGGQGAQGAADRERSNSVISRASLRRKLSDTGREVGSLPWCGCWGNGCV